MDPWHVYAGMFNILMIEEGDSITKFAKEDPTFKFLFIFVSVLSFVRNISRTLAIISIYYIIKYAILPYIKVKHQEGEVYP